MVMQQFVLCNKLHIGIKWPLTLWWAGWSTCLLHSLRSLICRGWCSRCTTSILWLIAGDLILSPVSRWSGRTISTRTSHIISITREWVTSLRLRFRRGHWFRVWIHYIISASKVWWRCGLKWNMMYWVRDYNTTGILRWQAANIMQINKPNVFSHLVEDTFSKVFSNNIKPILRRVELRLEFLSQICFFSFLSSTYLSELLHLSLWYRFIFLLYNINSDMRSDKKNLGFTDFNFRFHQFSIWETSKTWSLMMNW